MWILDGKCYLTMDKKYFDNMFLILQWVLIKSVCECECECVCFIVWYPIEFRRLHNLHPVIGTLSCTVSSPLRRIQHIFCSYCHSQFSIVHSTWYPSLLWTEAAWYERLAQHLYTWQAAWLEHRSPIQVIKGSALLNFSDLTRTGYHTAMCYHYEQSITTVF